MSYWNKGAILVNPALTLLTSLFLFLILEGIFRFAVTESDSFGQTHVAEKWKKRYFNQPRNSLGYRDREHPAGNLAGKQVVFVVGDSFVEGGGIEDVRRRFPDVMQRELGAGWEVINIAKSGWDTHDEFSAVLAYPLRPNVIVLSHFINDIDDAAAHEGLEPRGVVEEPSRWLTPLLARSYFLDYVYWRFYESTRASGRYWEYLENAYSNPRVLAVHKVELERFIEFSHNNQIRLIVLLFPHLRSVEKSRVFTDTIKKLLAGRGIEVLDLSDRLARRPFRELIVNAHDVHPSADLHREISQWLATTLTKPAR